MDRTSPDVNATASDCTPVGEGSLLEAERLDVYRVALEFQVAATALPLGRGARELRTQLERASISIVLNFAEGVGRRSAADRVRFFGIARGSAMECAAILDIVRMRSLARPSDIKTGRAMLVRIVQMLTRLCQRVETQALPQS